MSEDPPRQPQLRGDGWIKAGLDEMKAFLGDSLFTTIPTLWEEPLEAARTAVSEVHF
jgi:hypothetical protein